MPSISRHSTGAEFRSLGLVITVSNVKHWPANSMTKKDYHMMSYANRISKSTECGTKQLETRSQPMRFLSGATS